MKLEDHPTVQRIRLKTVPSVSSKNQSLDAESLKQAIQLQTGEGRNTAIALLKKVNPKAAANLVAQSNPPAK